MYYYDTISLCVQAKMSVERDRETSDRVDIDVLRFTRDEYG